MPSSEAILVGATTIANEWRIVAVAWHVALAVALAAIFSGWRPSNRHTGYVLAASFLSVSAAAWVGGNPFNGSVFAALFIILLWLGKRLSEKPVPLARPIVAVPGAMLIAFGSGYPHFLETDSWIAYTYAAPLGLLPCPTLSAVIGATLLFGLLGSAAWSIALIIAGLLYGTVGVFVLGMELDYVLLVGTLALLCVLTSSSLSSESRQASSIPTSQKAATRGMA